MQTKFKRHQEVKLLIDPNPEYIEYSTENESEEDIKTPIKKGVIGKINTILSNGSYHVEVFDENGESLAYVLIDEEYLEAIN